MGEIVRLGFVGCGKHALQSHAEIVAGMPESFSIVAAYDPDPLALNRMSEIAPNVAFLGSSNELIKSSKVDVVIIATPPEFHLDLLDQCISANKHVLCEKPLWSRAQDYYRGREIIARASEGGLILTSCHPRRFAAEYCELPEGEALLKGDLREQLGMLVEIHFSFFYHKPSAQWRRVDSLLMDHMNHEVDLINFLLGHGAYDLRLVNDGFDQYCVSGERHDAHGNTATLMFSGYRKLDSRVYTNRLELVFEKGRLTVMSSLKDGRVKPTVAVESFDGDRLVSNVKVRNVMGYPYAKCFIEIMTNFHEAIMGQSANYLTDLDLLTNTASCTTLVETGRYVS